MIEEWPSGVNYKPNEGSWSLQSFLDPIDSEFDGGNVRERHKPGDDVRIIQQTVGVLKEQFEPTVEEFLRRNRGRRIVMPVWLGSSYKTCVAMIIKPRSNRQLVSHVDIQMTVRVLREVVALLLDGTPVLTATENVAYSGFQVTASGGVPSYAFSIHTGELPAGISLNAATGVISGTPTETGSFADIVVRVTDQRGEHFDLDPFTLTVS